MKVKTLALAATLVVAATSSAFARCDKQCKAIKKHNNTVWKSRQAVDVSGDTYYVAVDPSRKYVLVGWDKSLQTVSLGKIEKAGSTVSRCKATDNSILSMLTGDRNTPINAKAFRRHKFLRVDIKC